jgi:hypothetical protein
VKVKVKDGASPLVTILVFLVIVSDPLLQLESD